MDRFISSFSESRIPHIILCFAAVVVTGCGDDGDKLEVKSGGFTLNTPTSGLTSLPASAVAGDATVTTTAGVSFNGRLELKDDKYRLPATLNSVEESSTDTLTNTIQNLSGAQLEIVWSVMLNQTNDNCEATCNSNIVKYVYPALVAGSNDPEPALDVSFDDDGDGYSNLDELDPNEDLLLDVSNPPEPTSVNVATENNVVQVGGLDPELTYEFDAVGNSGSECSLNSSDSTCSFEPNAIATSTSIRVRSIQSGAKSKWVTKDIPGTVSVAPMVSLSAETVSVNVGGMGQLTITSNYLDSAIASSSEESLATAAVNGDVLVVTGIAAGEAVVTVEVVDGDDVKKSATVNVTVTDEVVGNNFTYPTTLPNSNPPYCQVPSDPGSDSIDAYFTLYGEMFSYEETDPDSKGFGSNAGMSCRVACPIGLGEPPPNPNPMGLSNSVSGANQTIYYCWRTE
jgi:hypothetical protein